jgi:asparagine synthase (glutamine-hydrolysing)
MCGIAGFFTQHPLPAAQSKAVAERMAQAVARRGPDDSGIEVLDEGRLCLAFRRLAIIDLSIQGHQPMRSASGRYTVVFNGEIYNFQELRERLTKEGKAPTWNGTSDTEVLLAAVEAWGIESALKQFNGMFALALWDDEQKILHLARDRFGEKPLYFGWCNSTFLFGSELKALAAHPRFRGTIDRKALRAFLARGCVPSPLSILQGIQQLPPGSFVSIDTRSRSASTSPAPVAYWSAAETAKRSLAAPFQGSDLEAVDALDGALRKAVAMRTFADVPLGAFLSGGIDSSTIVAVMQAVCSQPVNTFTIGNTKASLDESTFATAIAQHLGTRHEVHTVSTRDALDIVPQLADYYSEPFADSSQIPTILVARMASKRVTVALSGDGGDELFGGYTRHIWSHRVGSWSGRVPPSLRTIAGKLLTNSSLPWEMVSRCAGYALPSLKERLTPSRLRTLGEILRGSPHRDVYDTLVSAGPPVEASLLRKEETEKIQASDTMPDLLRAMMYFDTISYLPDDIMVKVDRATMGESIEGRAPFLDPELFAFAWSLPDHLITDGVTGKLALRGVLERYVPSHLFERPKQGFAIPIGDWLCGELADWAESLLDAKVLRDDGYLDPDAVHKLWQAHKSGAADCERPLWHVLMFQSWLLRWRPILLAPGEPEGVG